MRIGSAFMEYRATYPRRHTALEFFWGSFDLAYARYSGRDADPPPNADAMMRIAMDAQEVAAGFWPGDDRFPEPAFYCYAYPKPAGIEQATIGPASAGWHAGLGEFVLRYDDEAALHALRPPGDESVTEGVERYPHWYFFSSAILDPIGTIDIVARLPHETQTQRIATETAWQELFASQTHRGEARWDLIREKQMFLWKPGSNGF